MSERSTNRTNQPIPDDAPEALLDAQGNFKQEQPKNTVRFTGQQFATVRLIRPEEWPPGVKPLEETVRWDLENSYTLLKDNFQPEHLAVLEADGQFSIK